MNDIETDTKQIAEIWATCVENNAYEVSNKGNVRLKGSHRNRKPVFIKNGYATITTTNQGKPSLYYIHRMVANAFIPNLLHLPSVNHIDHNKKNNCTENLEWCTIKHNVQHGSGQKVYVYDTQKKLIAIFNSTRDAEKAFNISHSSLKRFYIDKEKPLDNYFFYSIPLL